MPKPSGSVKTKPRDSVEDILGGPRPRFVDVDKYTTPELEEQINLRLGGWLNTVGKNDPNAPDLEYARGIADLMQLYELPMPAPAGAGGMYTPEQYQDLYGRYPAGNQMMSPAQELAATADFARTMAACDETRRLIPSGLPPMFNTRRVLTDNAFRRLMTDDMPPMFGARRVLNDNALSRLLGYE